MPATRRSGSRRRRAAKAPLKTVTLACALVCALLLPACTTPFGIGEPATPAMGAGGPNASGQSGSGTSAAQPSESGSTPSEPGASPSEPAVSEEPAGPPLHVKTPEHVRGIYLTGWTAGTPKALAARVDYIKSHHLNAMVIDIKDDGRLSFDLPGTEAAAIGASRGQMKDPKAILQMLHENGIYVIGRIVTFNDPYAAQKRPKWALQQNGKLWRDRRINTYWLSPWSQDAWNYNIEIGVAAAKIGFDEIQFDYIRLPAQILKGYNDHSNEEDRIAQVVGFLDQARETIHKEAGVPVSGDVFGITSLVPNDQGIGQRYPDLAHALDYISPMDYPSLYGKHEFGYENAALRPRDVVWRTVARAEQRTADLPIDTQRPWLQAYGLHGVQYGAKQIEAQLGALAAAGIHSFLLWNAANHYPEDVDYSVIDSTPLSVPAKPWLFAAHSYIGTHMAVRLPGHLPAVPEGRAVSVVSEGHTHSYTGELWATSAPLPEGDDAISQGSLLLVVQGAGSQDGLPALPAAALPPAASEQGAPAGAGGASETPPPAGVPAALDNGDVATLVSRAAGVTLTWTHGQGVYRIWAATRDDALAAANSMVGVTLLEGR